MRWIGPEPAPGDELWLELDPAGLDSGVLDLPDSTREILSRLGHPGVVLIEIEGQEIPLRLEVDPQEGLALLEDGARLRPILVGSRVSCRIESWDARCARLRAVPGTGRVDALPGADDELLGLVRKGTISSRIQLELHEEASVLARPPDLDTLICESLVRNFEPFDYQKAVVRSVLGRFRGRAILADEVGLGKTIEAGMVLLEYLARRLVKRCLVLVPPSLVGQWAAELGSRFGLLPVLTDDPRFVEKGAHAWDSFDLVLASLALAKREPHRSRILATRYDMVIVDEAHHLRSEKTLAFKLVSEISRRFTLLLTATPIQNDLLELYNLVTLLKPGQLETRDRFRRRYIGKTGPRGLEELRRNLREVMVRNRRADCGVILPPRRAVTLEVVPTAAEREIYDRLASVIRSLSTAPEGPRPRGRPPRESGPSRVLLRLLQQEAGSSVRAMLSTLDGWQEHPTLGPLHDLVWKVRECAKVPALARLVAEIAEPTLVFTLFRSSQTEIMQGLAREGITATAYHGQLTRLEKDAAVERFRDSGGVLVATESGGEGRNLQFCRNLVNFDLPWNPMRIEQRVGRIHRIGQGREVRIFNLLMAGTLEEILFGVLERKINLFELVVGELDMILGELEEEGRFEDLVFDLWAGAADETGVRTAMEDLGEKLRLGKEAYQQQKALTETVIGSALALERPPGDGSPPGGK